MSVTIRFRKSAKAGYKMYLDIYSKGQRSYESLDMFVSQDYSKVKKVKPADREKLDLAEQIRLKKELALRSGEHNLRPRSLKGVSLVAYFQAKVDAKAHGSYRAALNYLKECFSDKMTFAELDPNACRKYIKFLRGQVSETTAHHYIRVLNVVINEAMRDRIVTENPLKFLGPKEKPKIIKKQKVFLEPAELESLYVTPFPKNRFWDKAFLFSCFAGLRVSDMQKLEWSEITPDKTRLNFRQKKSVKNFQYLPLGEMAQQILKEMEQLRVERGITSERVFWDLPKSMNSTYEALMTWGYKANLEKKLTWHVGRHTYATLILAEDGDIYTLSKLMGHASITTTQIYGEIVGQKKRTAVDNLPVLRVNPAQPDSDQQNNSPAFADEEALNERTIKPMHVNPEMLDEVALSESKRKFADQIRDKLAVLNIGDYMDWMQQKEGLSDQQIDALYESGQAFDMENILALRSSWLMMWNMPGMCQSLAESLGRQIEAAKQAYLEKWGMAFNDPNEGLDPRIDSRENAA